MQKSRREFAKTAALITAGAAVTSTAVMAATSKDASVQDANDNGVVVGSSRKKEILYKKTAAWEEFYKFAK